MDLEVTEPRSREGQPPVKQGRRSLTMGWPILGLVFASCASPSGPTSQAHAAQILAVRITPETSELRVNAVQTFSYITATGPGVPGPGPPPVWESSLPAVAAVDANGRVTAITPGSTVLSISFRGQSDARQLRVVP
jgi:hypothetical protein